jgi:hypothetical protein
MATWRNVGPIPMHLPHFLVWSGRNVGIWLHFFVSEAKFFPILLVSFFVEKFVNASPALAERLHTSAKFKSLLCFNGVVNKRSKMSKDKINTETKQN